MLVLDDGCIPKVHPERVSQPAESLLDVVRQLSCLVKQYASPNPQGMSRVLLKFIWSSVGAYRFDGLPEELCNFVTSEENYLTLFCLIYCNEHVIRLFEPSGP
jgi:hypothetical protein